MCDYVNSTQAQFTKSPATCGVVEMHHLPGGGPEKSALALATHLYHKANPRPAAFSLWSDVVDQEQPSRGERLARFFQDRAKLGRLLETAKEINPKTGNVIRVWVLHLDHEEFRKWYTDQVMNLLSAE